MLVSGCLFACAVYTIGADKKGRMGNPPFCIAGCLIAQTRFQAALVLHQPQIGFRAFETEAYIGAVERFVFHIGFGAPAAAKCGVEMPLVGGGVSDFG